MNMIRFPLMVLAIAILASGISTLAARAQDDPEHAAGHDKEAMQKAEKKISEAMATLSPEDQKLAANQRFCPIMQYSRLGSMGTPIKVMLEGKPVFVCCKNCLVAAKKDGKATLLIAEKLTNVSATLAKLPVEERMAIEAQKYCPVQNKNLLGSMGAPVKLEIDGEPVYLCCKGCTGKAQGNPTGTLAKVEELKKAGMAEDHHGDDHDKDK